MKKKPAPTVNVLVTPGQLELNKNSSVFIHYVDVNNAVNNGKIEDFVPKDGIELTDQLQSYENLAIGDEYSNLLWDWASAGYILAEMYDEKAENGVITDQAQHHYIYLKHQTVPTSEEESCDKVVNQVIHYVYEDGTTAAPDHVSVQLVFTQTGTKDLVTGDVDWDGAWTETQRFVTVVSPQIDGYTADHLEIGPYDITVTNENADQNLDKEDTVIYKANPIVPTPDPTPDPTSEPDPDPIPDDEENIPPHFEEVPDPEPAEAVQKEQEDENIAPKANEQPTNKSVVTRAKVEEVSTAPNTSQATTSEKVSQNTLPETGVKKQSKIGILLSSLAAFLGITGLVGTSKKRKNKDE